MSAPVVYDDWLDFVRALLAADVRFLVVGAPARRSVSRSPT